MSILGLEYTGLSTTLSPGNVALTADQATKKSLYTAVAVAVIAVIGFLILRKVV